jgi:ornithine cyclodeaminase/alanine dehydrogenase
MAEEFASRTSDSGGANQPRIAVLMTLFYDARTVRTHATPDLALNSIRRVLDAEKNGLAALSPRHDVSTPTGFLRVMPGYLDGVMGVKVMTLVKGLGTRYLLLMFAMETGETVAVFDAAELSRTRTAAMTAVAAAAMASKGQTSLGVIGSGFEAVGHLRMLAAMWPLRRATVFSPNPERRERFARALSSELDMTIEPVSTAEAALGGHSCALLATTSTQPVVQGTMFEPGCSVLSIGSTRLDLRELDVATFRRAAAVVVDHPGQVRAESGDVVAALDARAITPDQIVTVPELGLCDSSAESQRNLLVFKSVGTILQDLALAQSLHNDAACRGEAQQMSEFCELKPFSAQADLAPFEPV